MLSCQGCKLGGGQFLENCPGGMFGGVINCPRKKCRGETSVVHGVGGFLAPHAGLQVSTCSGYD